MTDQVSARTLKRYLGLTPDRLDAALAEEVARRPRCAVTRYLLGCRAFDTGRPATAVRNLMVAHHSDAELESAALLVFAGLSFVSRRGEPLLTVLLDTWEEFRRPEFDRRPRERMLLDAFAVTAPAGEMNRLTGRLWRLPIQSLRSQIREALAARDAARYPLLLSTA